MFGHINPSVFKAKESMSSPSAKAADVEAGRCPFQHPGKPGFSGRVTTSRGSTVIHPMTSTSRVTTVLYPMSSNSQQPLAACRTLMNILCGIAVALTVFLAMYFYCTAVAAPPCPVHADLDLQLACMPETLAYHDVTVTRAHAQLEGQHCLDRPAQTLPQPQPCWQNISIGENNITCFVQKVFYQKWRVFDMVKFETATESPIGSSTTLRFVSEAMRSYHYSCRGHVQDELPRTSYKERLELVERMRTIRDISSQK